MCQFEGLKEYLNPLCVVQLCIHTLPNPSNLTLTTPDRRHLTSFTTVKLRSTPMTPRLSPSAISSLTSQILRSLQSPSPPSRLPSLPLPLSTPLILSVLRSSPSPLLSLRFYLHAFSLPSPLSPHSLSLFSSHVLPSLPSLLLHSPPPFPLSISSFRALFSLCLHPSSSSPTSPSLPSFSLNLLHLMQSEFNCKPDTFCYNTVIRVFAETDQAEMLLSLFQEMCRKHISPNMVTFVTLVKGLAQMGKVESARAVISDMALFGCTPNTVVYTSFLDGLCYSGNMDLAMEVLGQMEHELGKECEPNVVTYTCMIKFLCENGRMEDALTMLDRMGKRGVLPNRVLVRTILNGFCIDQHSNKVQGLVDSLVSKGGFSVRECYSLIVTCFSKTGRVDEAKILVKRMFKNGIGLDALAVNSLLRGLCEERRFLDVYCWLQENGYVYVDSDVYSCLLAGLCKEKSIKESVDLGRRVVEISIRVENRYVDCIIEGLQSFGEFELANRIEGLKEIDLILGS
ncbi:Pentatricopeptide repeat-containing protein [Rhynchospora pubera]|uniref:Pentatricopeptide repeat-containing protein n=1 Tax=Rhynchospora pubera TaxID=906938 RepID=A0AAV8C8L4_9POAL|nr:Pentatricopeptide repeat-containing protein [Rhynchospora pubera]